MIEIIRYYFILFIIYSFIGWSMEVITKLIEKKKFINRGFLIGPICPIYGCGCLLLIITLSKYRNNIFVLFGMAILICSVLEYLTSYIMEKLFNARWWDYSTKRFNLNGRICASTMIPFGILGSLVVYIINPIITKLIYLIPTNTLKIISITLIIIFISDLIISITIMYGFKGTLKTIEKDGTEEISKKVKEILEKRSYLYKRLVEAFPNFMNPKERLIILKQSIEKELKKYLK